MRRRYPGRPAVTSGGPWGPPEVTDGRQPEGSTQVQPGSWWPCGRALVDTIAGAVHFFLHGTTHELFDEESLGNELALRNGAAETRGRTSRVFDARGGGDSET